MMNKDVYCCRSKEFAHNATLDRDGGLVERSSCAATGRGPNRARVLGRAAVAVCLAARARSAINKQAKIALIARF